MVHFMSCLILFSFSGAGTAGPSSKDFNRKQIINLHYGLKDMEHI